MGQLGNISPAGSIAIGVMVGLLSTCIQSIGLTMQRKSHILEDRKKDEESRRPPYRRRRWQLGMFMFVVANLIGSTIQITTLPLPVLSTLQASGLVFNTICASIVLGEPFTRWSLIGTLLVAGGAVLVALYGAIPEPSHNLDQHLFLLERRTFILWMVGTALIIAAILASVFFFTRIVPKVTPTFRLYRGMAYGAISSILSAHSLLIASSAVELIVRTIVDRKNQFNRWQSWVILLLLVFFALSQLYFLHRGLKLVSTSVLYPFVFCVYNVFAILDGLIYFRQVSVLPALHGGLIALGTMILLAGVVALSWRLTEAETAPPAEPHTFLTPGMGIVEDTPTESSSDTVHGSPYDSEDEELALRKGERTPLLDPRARSASPKSQDDAILSITKHRRRFLGHDADAIWDELQEDSGRPSRWAGRSGLRRAVTMTPTSTTLPTPSHSSTQLARTRPRRAQTTMVADADKHRSRGRRGKRRYSVWGFPIGDAGEVTSTSQNGPAAESNGNAHAQNGTAAGSRRWRFPGLWNFGGGRGDSRSNAQSTTHQRHQPSHQSQPLIQHHHDHDHAPDSPLLNPQTQTQSQSQSQMQQQQPQQEQSHLTSAFNTLNNSPRSLWHWLNGRPTPVRNQELPRERDRERGPSDAPG